MSSYSSYYYVALTLLLLAFSTWRILRSSERSSFRRRSVAILVLGDIGRSPRMMYHAESFAQNQFETFLIGYHGSEPIPSLKRIPHVHFIHLSEPPSFLRHLPFMLSAPIKIIFQVITVLYALHFGISYRPEFILVQNPPSIPTLALVWSVGSLRGSKVIIDWHNLGYTILAMKTGEHHVFVKIAKWFEYHFGRKAYAHLFVTQAMHDYLVKEWNIQGLKAVLHDRPPKSFHRVTPQTSHLLFRQLAPHFVHNPLRDFLPEFSLPYTTPFTTTPSQSVRISVDTALESGLYSVVEMPTLRPDRPALIVSSTSWTPDENFGILLAALELYEEKARARDLPEETQAKASTLPRILVIVTGKGPQREEYMEKIRKLEAGWQWVRCISLWLEAQDYPSLLGSADLGVCLHSSSSGLDLPMKVVDMFGCGLPVCALRFYCLHELVKDGVNGLIFDNAEELADQLEVLLTGFPHGVALSDLRSSLLESSHPPPEMPTQTREKGEGKHWDWNTWERNWQNVVRPTILSDVTLENVS